MKNKLFHHHREKPIENYLLHYHIITLSCDNSQWKFNNSLHTWRAASMWCWTTGNPATGNKGWVTSNCTIVTEKPMKNNCTITLLLYRAIKVSEGSTTWYIPDVLLLCDAEQPEIQQREIMAEEPLTKGVWTEFLNKCQIKHYCFMLMGWMTANHCVECRIHSHAAKTI